MVSKDIVKKLAMTLEEFERNAVPDEIMINFQETLARNEEVMRLKETYSKRYLLQHRLVTREEYRTIRGESDEHRHRRHAAGVAEIMHRVVGAEFPVRRRYY